LNPRTTIEDLQLAGSPNLRRALKRQQADENAPPVTPEQEGEIAKIDALIAKAMNACRRGQTIRGRRNPAFQNLESLIKVRKLVEGRKVNTETTGQGALKEAHALFANLREAN
jgi:hypothetical protein